MIAFSDTNVLIYAFDQSETRKQGLAIDCFSKAVHSKVL